MTAPHILPLKDALDIDLVGGKAINLAKLMQADLPVPGGFVVTTAAFRAAEDGKVSEELGAQITEAFQGMDAKLVATRSSATAEDMAGASMAGQYETYLNLSTPEDVIDGVEKCWASIRSDRIIAYLNEHDIDSDQVAMAVVVQQLVAADVAGVLFTVDPQTGARDHMLIEAAWGLGETLVSGEVQPDVISIKATEATVESYQVATKKQAMYPGVQGFQPVKEEDQDRACLTYEQIMRLQELGQLAAAHFMAPQDIEWGIEDGEVYLLQARPITTLAETDAYNMLLRNTKDELRELQSSGRGPWVRHNLGETLPHPTPFTWQLASHFMSGDGGFGRMHEELGFNPGPAVRNGNSFLKRIGGEIYMDCSLMTEMFSEGYPFAYDVELLRNDPDAAQNPPTIATGTLGELGDAGKMAMAATEKIKNLSVDLDKKFDNEFVPTVLDWSMAQEKRDLTQLSNDELVSLWHEQVEKVLGEFGNMAFLPSMVEALAVEELRTFLEEHSWDEEPSELVSLLSVSAQPDCTIGANIELAQVASGKADLVKWLNKNGHRAPAEFELATPRWRERPDDVKRMAEQMAGETDIADVHHQRLQAAKDCIKRFENKLTSALSDELKSRVELVQRYCRFREDGKYYLMRAYSVLRRTALEFGRRLEVGEGVFFLTPNEVFEALKTGFVPKDKIVSRKLEYEVENRIQLPHVIDTEDIETLGAAPARADGPALQAHSVSNGATTGPVAIVLSPESVTQLPPGAILVCPSTDPSWTPLFVNASGLVLERGGSLSHGAVVAREMGLPAVVLDGATELFEDGESITVDANVGWIYREGADATPDPAMDANVARSQVPPSPSTWEGKANMAGLVAAIVWGVFLAAVYLLPEQMLHDPVMAFIDAAVWPLVRNLGMAGAVAVIAGLFGLLPILGQRFITDNKRLFEAKRRAGLLKKEANKLDPGSPRRKRLEELAAPTTLRVLKAAMVPLAFILGPMIMVFMWFPNRVDPASWAAAPGRMVSIVAEIDGECREDIRLSIPSPLVLDSSTPAKQKLPPIRKELEELRNEWRTPSVMDSLPWEVQSAGDHTRKTMLASLNNYLSEGVPPLKITWLVNVPEEAAGAHPVKLSIGNDDGAEFKLVFGTSEPPPMAVIRPTHVAIKSVTVNYPRALHQASFFTPLKKIGGPKWDFGWLGVYLIAYLPIMFIAKFALKTP